MDLSRAKIVLIITFLFLNLFLLYQIWMDEGKQAPFFFGQKEEVSRLETALEQARLSLDVPLPRGGMRVSHLIVQPCPFDLEGTARMLWPVLENKDENPSLPDDLLVIREDNNEDVADCLFGSYELFRREGGGLLLRHAFEDKTAEELPAAIEELVKQVPLLQDFVYDYKEEEGGGTVFCYRQNYEGFPLYAGYVHFSQKEKEGVDVNIYRLTPVGFAQQQREVIPPSTALWRFLETYSAGEVTYAAIVEFSLGYYSEEHDAQRWEIAPVWRIRLHNGELYYINAFTGYGEN